MPVFMLVLGLNSSPCLRGKHFADGCASKALQYNEWFLVQFQDEEM